MDRKAIKSLVIKKEDVRTAKIMRTKSIEDAVALSRGSSRDAMVYHTLWSGQGYEVGVGKPGKEATRVRPNPNDMWPFIKKGTVFEPKSASFSDIFHELEHMGNKSKHSLEVLGCLLARSALMLDHAVSADGCVIYVPPELVVAEIKKDIPSMFGVPLEVFLQYIEAIALNEDVKYQTRLNVHGNAYSKSAGRPNNLLTCSHLIAVLLSRTGLVDFAYGFSQQRGVSALKPKQFSKCFPYLVPENEQLREATAEADS